MEELEEEHQDRERQAKLMRRFLDISSEVAPLRGRRLEEVLADEESTRSFIESLSPTEFVEIVNGINGILRGKEKEEWAVDGKDVRLSGFTEESFPPKFEDKLELLTKAFEGAQKMNLEKRSIEDIAILLSASVNEVHPYNDANGRTSRLLYTLLTKGFNAETKSALEDILGESGREHLDVNPATAHFPIENLMLKEAGYLDRDTNVMPEQNKFKISNFWNEKGTKNLNFSSEVSEELKKEFLELLGRSFNDDGVKMALYKYAMSQPDISMYIKEFPNFNHVSLDKLCPTLTPTDIEKIIADYWQIKKLQVEKFIDTVVNPDKPEYQIETGDFRGSIFDYLKTQIKR